MRKKSRLIIALIPLLLGCANATSSSSSYSLSIPPKTLSLVSVDTSKPLVDRSGDEVLNGYSSYEDTSFFFSAQESIDFAAKGGSVFFVIASYSCGHCLTFEPIFFESLKDSSIRVGSLYMTETNESSYKNERLILQNAYGKDTNTGVDGATPRIYHLSGSSCTMLDFYDSSDTTTHFSRYLSQNLSENNIFHFSSFAAYSKGLESFPDALSFIYDYNEEGALDYYMNNLYETAKISAKPLLLIDYRLFDEDNKKSMASYYGKDSLSSSIISNKEVINIKSGAAYATSLIKTYYGTI